MDEENLRKIVAVLSNPLHLLLVWLAWDVGENINSLLRLQKRDFMRREDGGSSGSGAQVEYLVNLPREKLKRARLPRTEPTIHPETVATTGLSRRRRLSPPRRGCGSAPATRPSPPRPRDRP